MNTFARNLIGIVFLALFMVSCTSTSPKAKSIGEDQFVDVFDKALRASEPKVEYLLKSDEENKSLVAIFVTNSEKYYQLISLVYKRVDRCKVDTDLKDLGFSESFFGPGGATTSLVFCSSGFEIKLIDSNLLSSSETGHGIEIKELAVSLQELLTRRH